MDKARELAEIKVDSADKKTQVLMTMDNQVRAWKVEMQAEVEAQEKVIQTGLVKIKDLAVRSRDLKVVKAECNNDCYCQKLIWL